MKGLFGGHLVNVSKSVSFTENFLTENGICHVDGVFGERSVSRTEVPTLFKRLQAELQKCTKSRLTMKASVQRLSIKFVCSCSIRARFHQPRTELNAGGEKINAKGRGGNTRRAYDCPFHITFQAVPDMDDKRPWTTPPQAAGPNIRRNWQAYHQGLVCVCKMKFHTDEDREEHWKGSCKSRHTFWRRHWSTKYAVKCVEVLNLHRGHQWQCTRKPVEIPQAVWQDVEKIVGPTPGPQTCRSARAYLAKENPSLALDSKQFWNALQAAKAVGKGLTQNSPESTRTKILAMLVGSLCINTDLGFIISGMNGDGRRFSLLKFFESSHVYFFPTDDLESIVRDKDTPASFADHQDAALGMAVPCVANLLRMMNPHDNDTLIRFRKEGHLYWIKGCCDGTVSTTQLLRSYRKYTSPRDMAQGKLTACSSHRDTSLCDYCECSSHADVLAVFNTKRRDGLEFHQAMARVLNGLSAGTRKFTAEISAVQRLIKDKGWRAHRTEWPMFVLDQKVAGTLDAVFKTNDGHTVVVDWKLTNAALDVGQGKMLGSLKHLTDSRMMLYSLQLNVYRQMLLEWNEGPTVDMYIVAVRGGGDVECIKVDELDKEIGTIMQERAKSLAEYVEVRKQIRSHLQTRQRMQMLPPAKLRHFADEFSSRSTGGRTTTSSPCAQRSDVATRVIASKQQSNVKSGCSRKEPLRVLLAGRIRSKKLLMALLAASRMKIVDQRGKIDVMVSGQKSQCRPVQEPDHMWSEDQMLRYAMRGQSAAISAELLAARRNEIQNICMELDIKIGAQSHVFRVAEKVDDSSKVPVVDIERLSKLQKIPLPQVQRRYAAPATKPKTTRATPRRATKTKRAHPRPRKPGQFAQPPIWVAAATSDFQDFSQDYKAAKSFGEANINKQRAKAASHCVEDMLLKATGSDTTLRLTTAALMVRGVSSTDCGRLLSQIMCVCRRTMNNVRSYDGSGTFSSAMLQPALTGRGYCWPSLLPLMGTGPRSRPCGCCGKERQKMLFLFVTGPCKF